MHLVAPSCVTLCSCGVGFVGEQCVQTEVGYVDLLVALRHERKAQSSCKHRNLRTARLGVGEAAKRGVLALLQQLRLLSLQGSSMPV